MAMDRSYVPSSKDAIPYPTHGEAMSRVGAQAKVTGTGADLDVVLPFDPAYVEVFNETTLAVYKKFPTQAGVACLKEITAGTKSLVAANGITLGSKKVTLGSGVHAASDVLHIVAFGFPGTNL